jgi:hypothetical protein
MDIIEIICKGFILLFPKYRKQISDVEDLFERYDWEKDWTYKQHFIKNTDIGVFFNHSDESFYYRLWMYIGVKGRCYRTYLKSYNESMEKGKKVLENSFKKTLDELPIEEKKKLEDKIGEIEWESNYQN